jgi:hypothetical protein
MPSTTVLGGTLIFKVNGVQYSLAGTFTYDIGGTERDMRTGPDGVHGTIQKFRPPMVDCELQDGPAVSLAAIQAIDGVTITLELANGKTAVFQQASQVSDLVNDVVEAKIKCKFGAVSAQEFT